MGKRKKTEISLFCWGKRKLYKNQDRKYIEKIKKWWRFNIQIRIKFWAGKYKDNILLAFEADFEYQSMVNKF